MNSSAERPPVVLVVDDEPDVREVLGLALRLNGFDVLLAATGEEAADLCRRHKGEIRLALVDLQLPGMDGAQTLATLRGMDPTLRLLLMSGDVPPAAAGGRVGCDGIFRKPFEVSDLLRTVRRMCEGKG